MSTSSLPGLPDVASNEQSVTPRLDSPTPQRDRGLRFWLIILTICLSQFLSALELSIVSTALPTIVASLKGNNFVWVGSAYALSSSAILPMSGGIAEIFGRKSALVSSIGFFGVGSAVCGAAQSMNMLIAGRTIQGIGGGGIISLSSIVMGDLVPLEERGLYGGLFGLTWSLAATISPLLGGSLANSGLWRWIFYLNLPLCGVTGILTLVLLKLPTPPGSFRDKVSRMDWLGNFIIIASSCAATFGVTRGGINAPWSSAQVLAPLIAGVVGIAGFIVYEALVAKNPLVPWHILSNRTSSSAYIQTLILPITTIAVVYYIPVYFQAVRGASAIHAGVLMLGLTSIPLGAVLGGASVRFSQRYRPQIWSGWILMIIGVTLLTLIKSDTMTGFAIGFCVIYGAGAGINYATQVFPTQAPLPISVGAHALAFQAFMRTFAAVWGVTIGGAILQNELKRRLPQEFLSQSPQGVAIVFSVIPQISNLPEPLNDQVRQAFVDSLRQIWISLAGISGLGLFASLFMRGLPLHKQTDKNWAPMQKIPDPEALKVAYIPGEKSASSDGLHE
ncbi:MFS general substrate transporter [Hysterangium stoloniferum]|nr:MFS general substrate transporter [Hysterangium stoloniferum]